jgi:hypothetical protein
LLPIFPCPGEPSKQESIHRIDSGYGEKFADTTQLC